MALERRNTARVVVAVATAFTLASAPSAGGGAGPTEDLSPQLQGYLDAAEATTREAQYPPEVGPYALAWGATVFSTHCATCHGNDGKGTGPLASSSVLSSDLTSESRRKLIPPGVRHALIRTGIPGTAMPAFGAFDEFEAWALLSYVDHLAGDPPRAGSGADPLDGATREERLEKRRVLRAEIEAEIESRVAAEAGPIEEDAQRRRAEERRLDEWSERTLDDFKAEIRREIEDLVWSDRVRQLDEARRPDRYLVSAQPVADLIAVEGATVLGALDTELVLKVLRLERNRAELGWCLSDALIRGVDDQGRHTLKVIVSKDGRVSSAKSKWSVAGLDDEALARCLEGAATGIRFPSPRGGGILHVEIRLRLNPLPPDATVWHIRAGPTFSSATPIASRQFGGVGREATILTLDVGDKLQTRLPAGNPGEFTVTERHPSQLHGEVLPTPFPGDVQPTPGSEVDLFGTGFPEGGALVGAVGHGSDQGLVDPRNSASAHALKLLPATTLADDWRTVSQQSGWSGASGDNFVAGFVRAYYTSSSSLDDRHAWSSLAIGTLGKESAFKAEHVQVDEARPSPAEPRTSEPELIGFHDFDDDGTPELVVHWQGVGGCDVPTVVSGYVVLRRATEGWYAAFDGRREERSDCWE